MERLYKVLALIFLMMFCFCGFAENGSAYCVHNNSSITLSVIGETCARCYEGTLHSGASGCCPGADAGCRGTTMITVRDCFLDNCVLYNCPCKVTAHGDVYITGSGYGHLYATVYDDYGNEICEGPMQ